MRVGQVARIMSNLTSRVCGVSVCHKKTRASQGKARAK